VQPDRSIRWVRQRNPSQRSRSLPIQHPLREAYCRTSLLEDISDRKQVESDLQKAHAELEKRVAERTAELVETNRLLQQEIAERKLAQEALKAQREFLQTVLDTNPSKIFVKDREGRYVLANQACADFHGMAVEDLLGLTDAQLNLNQPDLEQFIAHDREVLSTLQPIFLPDKACSTSTGELRWYQVIKKPLFSSDGQACQILGVCTDITERKLVEEALRESEQQYRLLIEGINEGVASSDENGLLSYVNDKFSKMLGYLPEELLGHHLSEFLDESHLQLVQEQLTRRRSGESGSYELALKRKDGQKLIVIASASPILGTDGSFKGSFGVITDITSLKAVESQLQQAHEQLRAVLDAVPGFVSWISCEGRYLGVNQHLADTFNLSPDAFVGKELGFLKNSPHFVQFMSQFLASSAQTDHQVIEAQVNGSTRHYLIAAQKYHQGTIAVSVGIDITERKLAQEALEAQKNFLQNLIDSNPSKIFVKNRAGQYVLANQACADFYGRSVEDVLGLTDKQLNPNQVQAERYVASDQEVLTTLQPKVILEEACHTPTGEVRWYQTIKKPLFSSDGQVCQVFGVCTDITERKLAEEQLRHSEEQLRLALNAARMALWDWNIQTGKVTWTNNLERLLGVAPNTYNGTYKAFLASVHPEDRDRLYQASRLSLERGENCDIEFRIVWPDGTIRWIESKCQLFYDETGKPIHMTGINLDISDRKLAEEIQRRTQDRLRRLFEANLIGVIFADFSGNITEANDAFLEMVGYTREELYSGKVRWLDMTPPEYAEDDAQARAQISLTGVCTPHEKEYIRKDGNRVPILTGSALLEGSAQDCISFVLDLTWRKQAETQIRESLREKEVLLQEIHHRVKNNLQVISSLLDLQSQHIEEGATLEMFQESQNRVKSMALVHEKLYQSKDCARINFSEYIQNLAGYLFQAYAVNASNIALELDIDDVCLNIDTAIPCGLIISELVSNALKYAFPNKSGGGLINISLRADFDKHFILLVRDTGVGFPKNLDLKKVSSLGLQLVNVLTAQLEGTLELDCRVGTEFRIRFSQISC